MPHASAMTLFLSLAVSVAAPQQSFTHVDLQPRANHNLKDSFHDGYYANNDLSELPKGKQTFERVQFNIGEGMIQLGSKKFKNGPEKAEDIRVGRKLAKLHFLHATGYSVPDDTVIGKYVVHYEDKSKATIEIAYGKDVRDWWVHDTDKDVSRGKVAWTGSNAAAKNNDCAVRLYLLTWKNPKPRKKVISIDYGSAMTDAAPFLIAVTAEGR
ncbi:MAG TPA: hypothetical protein VG013_08490 [Gemmataceae bacterium]|jgi:hypothetical protein|nr:hypothetical protein [Gemmataceae bacterium]